MFCSVKSSCQGIIDEEDKCFEHWLLQYEKEEIGKLLRFESSTQPAGVTISIPEYCSSKPVLLSIYLPLSSVCLAYRFRFLFDAHIQFYLDSFYVRIDVVTFIYRTLFIFLLVYFLFVLLSGSYTRNSLDTFAADHFRV
jgi:hypothetical protein